jgi:hypothetical protein
MSVRDALLGSAAAYAISAAALVYVAFAELFSLAVNGTGGELPLAPVLVGGYTAVVGTGLLIGATFLREQRPES